MNTLLCEEKGDGLFLVRLNRPEQLNALNSLMLDELQALLDDLAERDMKGLIITGEGGRAFAAGADISEMCGMSRGQAEAFSLKGNLLFRRIETLPIPVIAAVNGYALGGGCELAMSCDLILCSSRAVFGQPETGLGICPGFGGTIRLAKRTGMQAAKELVFSGRLIKADEAVELGLALKQYAPEELLSGAEEMMKSFLRNSSFAISAAKKSMNHAADTPVERAVYREAECFSECFVNEDQRILMERYLQKGKK